MRLPFLFAGIKEYECRAALYTLILSVYTGDSYCCFPAAKRSHNMAAAQEAGYQHAHRHK